MSKTGYTLTAALPYANGPLHIGHIAGAYLPADIYARYLRRRGENVLFICGSDEGGAAITLQARQAGISPQALVERYHHQNERSFRALGISFDAYGRTSTRRHHRVAQDFFLKLYKKGVFITRETEEYYDEKAGLFLADRYLQGKCPHCSHERAYGDQCESCGTSLSSQDLIAPSSRISGAPLIKKKAMHYYLPLDRYQGWLECWLAEVGGSWRPNVYGQCLSWLKGGLRPRAMTRDLGWGVPLPLPNGAGKVLYVWFEALLGYISATQEWAERQGAPWQSFWQAPNRQLIHFIGKDNIVFHALIFPAMLRAHGDYILPAQVVANEFMNLDGEKISTSRKHAIWIDDYLKKYPGKEDVLRYVLCAHAPEGKDSNFTWQDFKDRNNKELVGVLGNFVHRTMVLLHTYYRGSVPPCGALSSIDEEVIGKLLDMHKKIEEAFGHLQFRKALETFMALPRLGNQYLAATAPWKGTGQRRATVLYINSQILAHIGLYSLPFLPFTSDKLRDMLQCPQWQWQEGAHWELLPSGHQMGAVKLLFEKIG